MEVGQDELVVTSLQDEIINTNDSDEERMAPDVVFDPRFKGPEPISPATEEALLTIVEDETVATNISSVHSETDVPSSQSSTAEIRSEINLIQLDVEPEAATASCTPRETTMLDAEEPNALGGVLAKPKQKEATTGRLFPRDDDPWFQMSIEELAKKVPMESCSVMNRMEASFNQRAWKNAQTNAFHLNRQIKGYRKKYQP